MSAQRLNDKSRRRIERATGLNITRAWAHGGYVVDFATPDPIRPDGHRHGWFDKKSGTWALIPDAEVCHYDTCREMFPHEGGGA